MQALWFRSPGLFDPTKVLATCLAAFLPASQLRSKATERLSCNSSSSADVCSAGAPVSAFNARFHPVALNKSIANRVRDQKRKPLSLGTPREACWQTPGRNTKTTQGVQRRSVQRARHGKGKILGRRETALPQRSATKRKRTLLILHSLFSTSSAVETALAELMLLFSVVLPSSGYRRLKGQ